jgi:hypothetical protein
MDIAEVRQKFPQYNDLSDADLASALHKKYYADLPFDQFASKIGLKGEQSDPLGARPKPATTDQKITASMPMRMARGMTDAVDAGAQYLPWALGAVSGGFGMAPNKVSDFFFKESDRVSKGITEREKAYQDARRAVSGNVGFDSARLSGNVLSPVNALLGAASPALPASVLGKAALGAGMGGVAALTTPVPGATSETLGGAKAGQSAVGAVAGGVLTPVASKAADVLGSGLDRIVNAVNRVRGKSQVVPEQVVYNSIRSELARENINIDDVPETILRSVRKQVNDALASGKKIDAAALVRQADFDAVGTKGTLGQITRDPVQYTREMNLRGVAGPGDPLMRRFNEQRQAFGNVLSKMGADKADDAYTATQRLAADLQAGDAARKAPVDAAYQAVRDSAGRPMPMDAAQFSKMANDALDAEMLGGNLPSQARDLLNNISTGKIPFDVQTQIKVRERLSGIAADQFASGNRQGALAVRQILNALDKTDVIPTAPTWAPQGPVTGGFQRLPSGIPQLPGPGYQEPGAQTLKAAQEARKLAEQRFGVIDRNPALKAVIDGAVDDQFINKFVVNGQTDDLRELSKILSPSGKDTVRQQIAAHLESKAFGSNVSGDSAFAVERYNEALKKMGREKLAAFFKPEEIDQLYAVGRAAAWAGKRPAGSAVNESNTAAAAMNLFSQIKGASIGLPIVKQVRDSMIVQRGLLAEPPTETLPLLSPALRALVPGVPVAAGVGSAGLLSY